MSKRRKTGDLVYLKPNAGFTGNSQNIGKVEIIGDDSSTCCLECGDPECREWTDLWTMEISGKRHLISHVSECEMLDEPNEVK